MLAPWEGILAAVGMLGTFAVMIRHHIVRLETARAWLKAGAVLVDVDTKSEFAVHHPGVAFSVPLEELARRAHELGSHENQIVVFAHSWWRGARAVHVLRGMGFWSLHNVAGLLVKEELSKSIKSAAALRENQEQPKRKQRGIVGQGAWREVEPPL